MKKNTEKTSRLKRVQRYAKISTTVTGTAARLARQKLFGMDFNRGEHAAALAAALGNLKGPLLKVAQLLATIPEALPPEYVAELRKLQSNAPPMGWPFVKRRMAAELGPDWEKKFKSFGREAAAAASLGQVHKAVLHDGRTVACKLQYPDMVSAIDADLRQLKMIFSLFEKYDKSVSTKYIHQELSERLYEELDYEREAKHCKLYSHMLADEKGVHVPGVVDKLSTDRLLVSTWLDGKPILSLTDVSKARRNRMALNMFQAWYVPLYHYGIIHGDPHPGNYTVRDDDTINLLDFGCVRVFPPRFIKGVIDLYHALTNDDFDLSVHAYESWGFENLSKKLVETLNLWAGFLYGPVLDDKVRPIGVVSKGGVYGRETASQVHAELRKIGGVRIPREFVFMDRAALGLGSVFLHLKAEINWHRLFNELIEGFDVRKLEKRQKETLAKFALVMPK